MRSNGRVRSVLLGDVRFFEFIVRETQCLFEVVDKQRNSIVRRFPPARLLLLARNGSQGSRR